MNIMPLVGGQGNGGGSQRNGGGVGGQGKGSKVNGGSGGGENVGAGGRKCRARRRRGCGL